jgi:FXSXX-COOH protein
MILTDEVKPTLSSPVTDLRGLSLAEMPSLGSALIDEAIERILPDYPVAPVRVAAFQSAI